MKSILILCAFFLASLSSFAASCPSEITVQFGEITKSNSSQMLELENTDRVFRKTKGQQICHYSTNVFLLTLKLYNYQKPYLTIDRQPFDENPGYSTLVDLYGRKIVRGVLTLNEPSFSIYEMTFDEEGCYFGQVPCGDMPVGVGRTQFERITIKLK